MDEYAVNEFMHALEVGAEIYADRQRLRHDTFGSSWYLRDSGYLYQISVIYLY